MASKNKTTQKNTVDVDPGYQALLDDIVKRLPEAFNGEFQAYDGQRIAGLSEGEQTAFDRIFSGAERRDFAGDAETLLGMGFGNLAEGPTSENLARFMNPYDEAVLERTIGDLQERYEENSAALASQTANKGSFGGSGQVLAEARLRAETEDRIGDMMAAQRQASFNQGMDRFYEDTNMNLQGGLQAFNLYRQDNQDLINAGTVTRTLDQMERDFDFSEFNQERNQGREDMINLSQLGYQYPTQIFDTTSETTQKNSPNPLQIALGVGSMAAGAFTGNPMAVMGGLSTATGGGSAPTANISATGIGNDFFNANGIGTVSLAGKKDGGLITEEDKDRSDAVLGIASYDEPKMSKFESYFENPLTRLGINLLSGDSVGDGLANFISEQDTRKQRARQEAIAQEEREYRRGRDVLADQRQAERDAANDAYRNEQLADKARARALRERELGVNEERYARQNEAKGYEIALNQNRRIIEQLQGAFVDDLGNFDPSRMDARTKDMYNTAIDRIEKAQAGLASTYTGNSSAIAALMGDSAGPIDVLLDKPAIEEPEVPSWLSKMIEMNKQPDRDPTPEDGMTMSDFMLTGGYRR
ncbi:MAG: hypothetical protein HRT61_01360 [Ekhidna sp.]|nr:hypothetical protein [Ekhidna sp.]